MTIWKFPARPDMFVLEMPSGARILSIDAQNGKPFLWALVDPDAPKVQRRFLTAGTGHPLHDSVSGAAFVGTFQLHGGALVFHLFDFGVSE